MAGYDGFSMSNNAVRAYDENRMPMSAITARVLRGEGIKATISFVKWLIVEKHFDTCEWHHTSSQFNQTNFYDLEALKELLEERGNELLAGFQASKLTTKAVVASVKVKGSFVEFSGSRSHPTKKVVKFTGVLTGNWIKMTVGGRKKAFGNWIAWTAVNGTERYKAFKLTKGWGF